MNIKYLLVLTTSLLSACQMVPPTISGDFTPMTVTDARKSTDSQAVRWGGVIAKVDNQEKHTVIEIVAKPLGSSSRPKDVDSSNGRFLAIIPEFIDPVVYEEGREVTVTGNLSEVVEGKIGEMGYLFPVVNVSGYHLWKERKDYQYQHDHLHPVSFWPSPYWLYHPYNFRHPKKSIVRRPIQKKSTK